MAEEAKANKTNIADVINKVAMGMIDGERKKPTGNSILFEPEITLIKTEPDLPAFLSDDETGDDFLEKEPAIDIMNYPSAEQLAFLANAPSKGWFTVKETVSMTSDKTHGQCTYRESRFMLNGSTERRLRCQDCSTNNSFNPAMFPSLPYHCASCGKFVTSFTQDGLVYERNHFPCTVCGKVFLYRSRLRLHMVSHSEEKPFTCLVCGKGFAHRYNYDNHMTIHSGEMRYACDSCGRAFPHIGALNRHAAEHSGEWPYKCQICHKGFSWDSRLKEHLISHTKEKPFKCQICGKGFSWEGRLKNHLASHSSAADKPFKCEVCGKSFTWVSRLKNHLVSHSEEKPFKCEMCGKGYSWASSLKDHMVSHSLLPGENRFKCDICGKGYAWHSSLKDHMVLHAKEKSGRKANK